MSTFVGGKLKLKGGVDPTQLKGGIKKKKKKDKNKDKDAVALVPADGVEGATEAAAGGEGGDQQQQQDAAGGSGSASLPPGAVKVTKEGIVLDPSQVEDRRTEAEKKAEAHFLKYEEQRAKKAAAKSHRERIKELNEKLSTLTEHNDIFRISYTA